MIPTCPPPPAIAIPRAVASVPPLFAFGIQLPPDCLRLPRPAGQLNFDDPATFASLGEFVAAYGTFVFSVAARPAYASGSLRDWLFDLCERKGFEIERAAPVLMDGKLAASCLATQKNDTGVMKMRVTLLEDAGRLFVLSASAPAPLWRAHCGAFDDMFASFKLTEKFGPTVQVA